jgi:hypothetical protein
MRENAFESGYPITSSIPDAGASSLACSDVPVVKFKLKGMLSIVNRENDWRIG